MDKNKIQMLPPCECEFDYLHLTYQYTAKLQVWKQPQARPPCFSWHDLRLHLAASIIKSTVGLHPLKGDSHLWINDFSTLLLNGTSRDRLGTPSIAGTVVNKISFSHHNNFSYGIKAYSPFHWSSTHFVRTSGAVLLIVEIHTHTFLPLLIPLKRKPVYKARYRPEA